MCDRVVVCNVIASDVEHIGLSGGAHGIHHLREYDQPYAHHNPANIGIHQPFPSRARGRRLQIVVWALPRRASLQLMAVIEWCNCSDMSSYHYLRSKGMYLERFH